MSPWLVPVAFAGPFDGLTADIRHEADIAGSAEAAFAILTDLDRLKAITPADCAGSWVMGPTTTGVGATARVRYDIAAMHRHLDLVISRAETPRIVEYDHAGRRGFVTRWTLAETAGKLHVEWLTPINPPPWPFRGYYFRSVKPAWEDCAARTVQGLATALKG